MPQVSEETISHLSQLQTIENKVFIPIQLDRRQYIDLNRVLEASGGKWSRKDKAHIFTVDPTDVLDQVILTGEYFSARKSFDQFDTPDELAQIVIDNAGIKEGMEVLEPSAGIGNLAMPAVRAGGVVTCYEIDPQRVIALKTNPNLTVVEGDFMKMEPKRKFDVVVMNPPFSKQQDINHVLHAYRFLDNIGGGRLVSVVSASVLFRDNSKTKDFRSFVKDKGGAIEALPEGSFKSSGTMVRTALVTINR